MSHIIEENDLLVRIFLNEKERHKGYPVYEYIVLKCRELGIAGATVFKGIMGYGADKRLHSAKFIDLSEELPIVIEIVDTEENINKLRPYLNEIIDKCFITIESVSVIKYRK